RLREQVKTTGRFAEENYTAQCKQVKGIFEVGLEPSPSLGQDTHFAKLPSPHRGNAAGLAPVRRPQHQRLRFLGGHLHSPHNLPSRLATLLSLFMLQGLLPDILEFCPRKL